MTKFWGKLTLLKLLHKNKTMAKIPVFKYASVRQVLVK